MLWALLVPVIVNSAIASLGGEPLTQDESSRLGDIAGKVYCRAFLIRDDVALTAAHCVEGLSPGKSSTQDSHHSVGFGQDRVAIRRIAVHPDYDPEGSYSFGPYGLLATVYPYDLALIQLWRKPRIAFGRKFLLPTKNTYRGIQAKMLGFHDNNEQRPVGLNVEMTRGDVRFSSLDVYQPISDQEWICPSDSGSPVVLGTTVIGLVSSGMTSGPALLSGPPGCGENMARGVVFTSTYHHRHWIEATLVQMGTKL